MQKIKDGMQNELVSLAKRDKISKFATGGIIGRMQNKRLEILVITRSPLDFMPSIEELPGGKVEDGETLTDSLRREIKEETNLTVVEITGHLFSFDYSSPHGATRQFNFITMTRDWEYVHLSDEHVSHRWIDGSQVSTSKLTDNIKSVIMAKWNEIQRFYE